MGRGVCRYLGQVLRLSLGRIDQHAADEDRAGRINPLGNRLTLAEIKGGGRGGCSLTQQSHKASKLTQPFAWVRRRASFRYSYRGAAGRSSAAVHYRKRTISFALANSALIVRRLVTPPSRYRNASPTRCSNGKRASNGLALYCCKSCSLVSRQLLRLRAVIRAIVSGGKLIAKHGEYNEASLASWNHEKLASDVPV